MISLKLIDGGSIPLFFDNFRYTGFSNVWKIGVYHKVILGYEAVDLIIVVFVLKKKHKSHEYNKLWLSLALVACLNALGE